MTRNDGTLNDAHAYFPDGESWIDSGPQGSVDGYLFNGKQYDSDTGFYDFGQRFYDPKSSLWLGIDPVVKSNPFTSVGRPLLGHPLTFAGLNPHRFRDPNGRQLVPLDANGNVAVPTPPPQWSGGGVELREDQYNATAASVPSSSEAMANHTALVGNAANEGLARQQAATSGGPFGWMPRLNDYGHPPIMIALLGLGAADAGEALYELGAALVGRAAVTSEVAGAEIAGAELSGGAGDARGIVDADKFRYLFGDVTSNAHNTARSIQNMNQLARVGVYNTAEGQAMLQSHFESVVRDASNVTSTFTNKWGTFQVRDSLFAGPGGLLKFESTWQVLDGNVYRFSTAIPVGGR